MSLTTHNLGEPTPAQFYSDAVVSRGLVFTTGQMPLDEHWDLVSESFDDQAAYVFDRLEKLLHASGAAVSSLVRVTIYLADIHDTPALAPHRKRFLGNHRPASVIVQTGGFGTPGMRLEVEAIAAILD